MHRETLGRLKTIIRASLLRIGEGLPVEDQMSEVVRDIQAVPSEDFSIEPSPPSRKKGLAGWNILLPANETEYATVKSIRTLIVEVRQSLRSELAPTEEESPIPRGPAANFGKERVIRKGEFPGQKT